MLQRYTFWLLVVVCLACQDRLVVKSLSIRPSNACSRRRILQEQTGVLIWTTVAIALSSTQPAPALATAAAASDITENLKLLQQARRQLDAVPDLIRSEKWDSVRAILITPPLADCWAKTSRPLLSNYADTVGNAGGDELAALEGKEDTISHLRYLDMAVYNNVFNPIKTEGETGATRGLIKSYYEDPVNEWKASVEALEGLIKLAEGL